MKILKTYITVEIPLLPGMENKQDKELEEQQERYFKNLLFNRVAETVDVVTKVIEVK